MRKLVLIFAFFFLALAFFTSSIYLSRDLKTTLLVCGCVSAVTAIVLLIRNWRKL